MKKIIKYLTLAFLAGSIAFGLAQGKQPIMKTEAAITSNDVRIAVVRPSWWESDSAQQLLRVAPTSDDLTNNTNITSFTIESYTADSYYNVGEGGFDEYDVSGVVFYDIPYSTLVGKYVDLVRLSPDGTSRWNKTGSEAFSDSLLHKIWRIWNDGNGVFRPSGITAESRDVSNTVVNSLLYGYLTCTSSTTNGYGAFKDLNDNFNLVGRTFAETDTVLDFISTADYATGRGAGLTVKTSEKIAAMQSLYTKNIGPLSGRANIPADISSTKATVIVGVLGLSLIIGYHFISKKRIPQ